MLISELVVVLEEYKKFHGDIPILFDNSEEIVSLSFENWPAFTTRDGKFVEKRGPAIYIKGYDYKQKIAARSKN